MMNPLVAHIQALVFCAQAPVAIEEMQKCLSEALQVEVTVSDVLEAIEEIHQLFASEAFAFRSTPLAAATSS